MADTPNPSEPPPKFETSLRRPYNIEQRAGARCAQFRLRVCSRPEASSPTASSPAQQPLGTSVLAGRSACCGSGAASLRCGKPFLSALRSISNLQVRHSNVCSSYVSPYIGCGVRLITFIVRAQAGQGGPSCAPNLICVSMRFEPRAPI
jgi:hypothetical protein